MKLTPIATIPATMSSREIADLTGKRHDHVLRDCEVLDKHYAEMGGLPRLGEAPYIHEQNGQEFREYQLNRMQTFDLITGYDVKLRIRVNRRWEELEQLRGSVPAAELAGLRAELADLRSLLVTGRRMPAQPKAGLTDQEQAHIARFWESLGAYTLTKGIYWTSDMQYIYIRMPLVLPLYEAYCNLHRLEAISTHILLGILRSGRYGAFVPSQQKGDSNSMVKPGFGRCFRFRYEQNGTDERVGGELLKFVK